MKPARKRPAKRKNKLPNWVTNPDYVQPTKSTRTFKKTKKSGGKTRHVVSSNVKDVLIPKFKK